MSQNLIKKTWLVALVFLLVGVLATVAVFFAFNVNAVMPPSTHQQIIDSMTIVGNAVSTGNVVSLTPKCVASTGFQISNIDLSIVSLSTTFDRSKIYQESAWLWLCHGDSEFAMKIIGPDETGKTYQITIGRTGAGGTTFTVSINGATKLTILKGTDADWATESGSYGFMSSGYYWFYVTLP
jgi:hypothetical protein